MTTLSLTMHAVASLLVLAGTILAWSPKRSAQALGLQIGALAALLVSIILRWVVTGHPPIFGTFENTAAATFFILVAVILDQAGSLSGWLPGRVRPAMMLWACAFLLFGVFFEPRPFPLTISERNVLVDIHALVAWISHTVLLAVGTAAVLRLVDSYRSSVGIVADQADEVDAYHDFMFKGAGVGLAVFTLMIAVGAFYNYALFARWFTWEIVEVFAIAAWLAYSSVLHTIMFFKWSGRRLAWLMVASTVLMLGTFWVWSFYTGTYHHFEIPTLRAR